MGRRTIASPLIGLAIASVLVCGGSAEGGNDAKPSNPDPFAAALRRVIGFDPESRAPSMTIPLASPPRKSAFAAGFGRASRS